MHRLFRTPGPAGNDGSAERKEAALRKQQEQAARNFKTIWLNPSDALSAAAMQSGDY